MHKTAMLSSAFTLYKTAMLSSAFTLITTRSVHRGFVNNIQGTNCEKGEKLLHVSFDTISWKVRPSVYIRSKFPNKSLPELSGYTQGPGFTLTCTGRQEGLATCTVLRSRPSPLPTHSVRNLGPASPTQTQKGQLVCKHGSQSQTCQSGGGRGAVGAGGGVGWRR